MTFPSETLDDAQLRRGGHETEKGASLFVVLECDRPLAGSARYALDGVHEVLFARGPLRRVERIVSAGRTTLRLEMPGSFLSSTHARLRNDGGEWILEDARSRNGTYVNGNRVTSAPIGDDDVIEVGHKLVVLRSNTPRPKGEPLDHDPSPLAGPRGMRTVVPDLSAQYKGVERIASSAVPVLLLGESGTGKELMAQAIHALSKRAGSFVAVNCGALPAALVEGQMFGHVKGAFSGAMRDEVGYVRAANGGTLLLDEIGDLPKTSQTALLRVLQEGQVVPLGTTRAIDVDTRILAATHRALNWSGPNAELRGDLFSRLAGFTFRLLPLRDRREDLGLIIADLLPLLARERADTIRFTPEVGRAFFTYDWPLNARELQQCLAASVVLTETGTIEKRHLPDVFQVDAALPAGDAEPSDPLRAALMENLTRHRGNVTAVGRAMGKAPMQIHRWLRRLQIDPKSYRS